MTVLRDRPLTHPPGQPSAGPTGGLTQLGALAASLYSLLAVWVMVAGLTFAGAFPSTYAAITDNQLSLALPERTAVYPWVLLACAIAWYVSFPLARFGLRLFPLKANGNRRPGLILLCVLLGALWLFITWMIIAETFLLVVPLTVLLVSAAVWMLYWHVRAARLLDKPFILFLRRFSTFSDRAVMSTLLAARPRGYRTAFLVPPLDSPANFSPVLLAFAGTSFVRPLEACPVPIQARDVEWEDNIEDLARQASYIVIDLSEPSPAIAREIAIARAVAPPDRIVLLCDKAAERVDDLARAADLSGSRDRLVEYSRSWRSAIPRILVETLTLGIVAVVFSLTVSANADLPLWAPWLIGSLLILFGLPVVLKPNVDRAARGAIERALMKALPSRPQMRTARRAARDRCAIVCPMVDVTEHQVMLSEVIREAGMEPCAVSTATNAGETRRAIRIIRTAAVVVGDLSTPDQDVDYLLGVAHGLGRKVVLVSASVGQTFRGQGVQRLAPDRESRRELTRVLDQRRRNPLGRGPVGDLLADEWVFGDRIIGPRLVAFLVDLAVGAALVAGYVAWSSLPVSTADDFLIAGEVCLLMFPVVRFLTLVMSGTTPGMALVGLRVIDADGGHLHLGQAAGRSFAALFAWMPFSCYFFTFAAPRYQSLEDALSGTLVVRRSP